ncbi:UNVERIFIED_CONTAM: Protein TRANSPARENT TESTA 9 [Sesamum indicum]
MGFFIVMERIARYHWFQETALLRDLLERKRKIFLTDQLMKVQIVNEVNKDFVIEALRSIAELITYGDQHDNAYFEFFMEKQVMGEFVRILKTSRTLIISLQLLQTMSIMIQNLKNEHSIYYMFSNEHVNYLITYSFDFRNEELLSYYISFLRAISGKLNKDTISLLVKTQNEEVVSFPLYVEAIRFAFHEESMIRTAVRALTLNIYHVGDDAVNMFVSRAPHADYFLNLVKFFRDQCIHLNLVVSNASKNLDVESTSTILSAVDEIEDNLYYFSDVVSAGIPDVGRLIMDSVLKLLIFPLILPSLRIGAVKEPSLGAVSSLYLLCCILRIVKIKDLANTVAAALLYCPDSFPWNSEAEPNGNMLGHGSSDAASQYSDENNSTSESDARSPELSVLTSSSSLNHPPNGVPGHDCGSTPFAPREALLSFVTSGDDVQVSGSLNVLATLLQTKELDESMVDALGILPQRKQHKKKLLQALVGEDSGEEQLFSSKSCGVKDGISSELDIYLQKLKGKNRYFDIRILALVKLDILVASCGHLKIVLVCLDLRMFWRAVTAGLMGQQYVISPFTTIRARSHFHAVFHPSDVNATFNCFLIQLLSSVVDCLLKLNKFLSLRVSTLCSGSVIQDYVGVSCASPEVGVSPRVHRFQVLDALVSLFCRSNISAETLWDGGWLLRQLLPYSEAEFNSRHLRLLKDSFRNCTNHVIEETRGTWSDLLVTTICDEWRKCKRAIEASSPRKDPKFVLLPPNKSASDENASGESSIAAGERMCETVKVFVLLHHLHIFSLGRVLPDQPPVLPAVDIPENSRAKNADVNPPGVKPNTEINLVDVVPCRIAFERGKERHFHFLALSVGTSGWLVLAEELPMISRRGIVRVAAPLAGCNPRIDDKHPRWLHLRIRPSTFPFTDTPKYGAHGKVKSKSLVDGRWTLAFRDEESCKHALSMILEELKLQSHVVERSLQPLLELDRSSSPS